MQLIHVGYPKSASTTLQNYLFDNPALGFKSPFGAQCIRLLHDATVVDTFEFDSQLEAIKARYRPSDDDLVSVYSHESLLVDPYGGRSQVREGIRRIRKIFDQPKILLIIREQKSAVISSYNEHLRRGYATTFKAFVNLKERELGYRTSVCKLDEFRYDHLISCLYQTFDRENVLVLPVEMINSPEFLQRLYLFLNRPQPPALPEAIRDHSRKSRKSDLIFLRHFNKLICPSAPSSGSLLRKGLYLTNILLSRFVPDKLYRKKLQQIRDMYDDEIGGLYRESNRRTSELIGIDLGKYNYQLA